MPNLEYAMFLWNRNLNTYEQVTRPASTAEQCQQEFNKKLVDKRFSSRYNLKKFDIKVRFVHTSKSSWMSIVNQADLTTGKQRYFIDIDGTLAEFKKLATMEELLEEGYFLNLKPLLNVVEAIKKLTQEENAEVFLIS